MYPQWYIEQLQNEQRYGTNAANQAKQNEYNTAIQSGQYESAYPVDPKTGKPLRPTFQSANDADGTAKDQYTIKDNLNRQSLESLRAEANRKGPSQWAQLQTLSQADDIARRAQGQTAQGLTTLASQGGLSSGARERLISGGNRNALMEKQNSARQIGMQDETNRLNALNSSVGAELNYANYDQGLQGANIQTALQDVTQKRMFDTNNYNEQMRAWGAEKTAAATPKSGKK